MKVAIIGSRGIPAKYGGYEKFAEEISKRFAEQKIDVTVVAEKGNDSISEIKQAKILYAKSKKSEHPVRFYFQSLWMTAGKYDVILVLGLGASFFYPILKSKSIIITHVDGIEQQRQKFSYWKKLYVKYAQYFALIYSRHLIADANAIEQFWKNKFKVKSDRISTIAYGAEIPEQTDDELIKEFNVTSNNYDLVISRCVPENNLEAIFSSDSSNRKILFIGADNSDFRNQLEKKFSGKVIFHAPVYSKEILNALRSHCQYYFHGHSVGGTNPSLLEAMACNCKIICHDNEFNREVTQDNALYFQNQSELAQLISNLDNTKMIYPEIDFRKIISEKYSWNNVTRSYVSLFQKLMQK